MAFEGAGGTTLNYLNELWPTTDDGLDFQDDHTRLLKEVLKSAFGDNPNALEFTADWVLSGYLKSAQMVKAGCAVNGADGVVLGNSVGLGAGLVERIQAGTYEVQLAETGFTFDDLHASFNINYSLGGIGIATMIPAETNTDGTWVRLVVAPANDPTQALDPLKFSFAIFDYGRNA